jgi:hypothetical protein
VARSGPAGCAMTSLPSWAVPGRKVVCVSEFIGKIRDIDGRYWPPSRWGYTMPVVKSIYTICEVRVVGGAPGVRLVEIDNSHVLDAGGKEIPFALKRFRPVVTLEEDMLTFRSLLNTLPANNQELTHA